MYENKFAIRIQLRGPKLKCNSAFNQNRDFYGILRKGNVVGLLHPTPLEGQNFLTILYGFLV